MRKIVKQVAAIDVAKNELVVCLGRMYDDWTPELFAGKTFANNAKGMTSMLAWVRKLHNEEIPVRFVMEATGVYHESLVYYLNDELQEVSIVLPNKISNYMRTLETKTITDKTASEAIALFGLERRLDKWKRPKEIFRKLRQLTRERDQIVQERTIVKNQLHAEQTEAHPGKSTLARIKSRIKMLDKQETEIKQEIAALIATDAETKKAVALITTVSGVGVLTAAIILAETNGFEHIRNKRQLASYAGFDVKEKQSGISIKGKPRISKKGNKNLRKAMHLPALAAIRYDERFKAIFSRIVSKHGIKMKAAVAVQRKILEMTYTIFKTGKKYDKNYLNELITINT
ncbi:MAG: IS110 family transposase [Bacteroidota bacterium]|jgi:transposase|nr:IS110 family transposase [Flavisolibacter sp.]MDQ3552399.1 IS110 family transposase [Bacteroidota bacterium]